MIKVVEVPDTNFINISDATLSGHTVTITDTADVDSDIVEIELTEASNISFTR
jgi:hypothetical protein